MTKKLLVAFMPKYGWMALLIGAITLVNKLGEQISKISLTGGSPPKDPSWLYRYPQFYPRTVSPIRQHQGKLLFSGEYMTSIPDSIIDGFQYTANINTSDDQVAFSNKYPKKRLWQ